MVVDVEVAPEMVGARKGVECWILREDRGSLWNAGNGNTIKSSDKSGVLDSTKPTKPSLLATTQSSKFFRFASVSSFFGTLFATPLAS
jgi:hypothetical protein